MVEAVPELGKPGHRFGFDSTFTFAVHIENSRSLFLFHFK